jgi:hypothetical protein
MNNEPKTELPPESFDERAGSDPQPEISNRPIEEETRRDQAPPRDERKNEGVGTAD